MTQPDPTEAQMRVLKAMGDAVMEANAADPTSVGIPDELVAERLGMFVEEVRRHVRALVDFGFIRVEQVGDAYWEEDPDGLTMDERRVYEAYQMALDTDRPHRTHTEMAAQMGMTVQEIEVITEKLGELGLLNSTWDRLTEDQQRVLMAMPAWQSGMGPGPSTAELAEQLGMNIEDVRECLRVLKDGRWLWDIEPTSVLDALIQWGWHTPADELARRLHMDLAEVDQRLLELAELGYDVRLI